MITINLKGREVPLIFTTWEMKEIQENIAPLGQAVNLILAKKDEKEPDNYGSPEHIKTVATAVTILGNAGLEENGENPDLTEKKVMRAIKPLELPEIMNACLDAMAEGMASEIQEKKKTGPVDVVLEEIEKKKEKDG